jgi:hypothetical protein
MRFPTAIAVTVMALALAGCPNPNDIGVQTYGTVAVTVIQASNGKPVAGALVNAGSTVTCTTGADGMCASPPGPLKLPVGKWTIVASAPGLQGSADVTITENTQASVTIQVQ